MDSCGVSIGVAGGFGITTLGGESGGRFSWGRRIGRSIERGSVRVCESVVRCGFVCGGLVVFFHRWMSWLIASIAKSLLSHAM